MSASEAADVDCLLFDVGGSVFDWESAIVESIGRISSPEFSAPDPTEFAATWRRRSLMHMYDIAAERVPWRPFDDFVDEALTDALDEHRIGPISDSDRSTLGSAWRRMPVWPEVVSALRRLEVRYVLAPHTILSLAAVAQSSKRAGLRWDAIISCDALKATKTNPTSYLLAAEAIGFRTDRICYVAAHTSDLRVVRGLGMRTAHVRSRLDEYGETPIGGDPTDDFDVVVSDYRDLADRLL